MCGWKELDKGGDGGRGIGRQTAQGVVPCMVRMKDISLEACLLFST